MKALVLGSNGYLGRHLVASARDAGWSVQTSDIQTTAWDGDSGYHACDVRLPDQIVNLDFDVDLVFMFTGLSGTIAGFERFNDYIDINEKGLVGVLEHLRSLPRMPKIIFPSRRLVYKGARGKRLREEDEKESLTIYAVNNRAAENYLELYQRVFGLRYAIFRVCVPYGNRFDQSYSYGTVGFFLRNALAGRDITLYGDGSQRRTFSHVDDICSQLISAAPLITSDGHAYNIAGGDDLSLHDSASLIARRYGVRVGSSPWPPLDYSIESGDTVFDTEKITALTGYQCRWTLASWLDSI